LGHGADYLTSLPKEGMLRIFTSEKSNGFGRIWTRELGNQRPLDHRSCRRVAKLLSAWRKHFACQTCGLLRRIYCFGT
jgi:hypothetical protein